MLLSWCNKNKAVTHVNEHNMEPDPDPAQNSNTDAYGAGVRFLKLPKTFRARTSSP